MNRLPTARTVLLLLALVMVLGLFIISNPMVPSPRVSADDGGELWLSSAPQPEGVALEQLSPPDEETARGPAEPAYAAPENLVTRHLRVAGSTLRPRESDVTINVGSGGGCTYAQTGDAGTIWNTAVTLPQGSTVEFVRMYYNDTNGSINMRGWFTVYDLYGTIVDEWGVSSSGGNGNGYSDSDAINHEIDYAFYNYVLNWRPNDVGGDMQLCGFRLFYQPPPFGISFLPGVLNGN